MARESFFYPETQPLFRQLESVSQQSGVSRDVAFQDFLTASVAALAAETMEDEYLAMVERHKAGAPGKRSIDRIAQMFAGLVHAITLTDQDILGDLFQSSISHQESGQFLTPECISRLTAQMSVEESRETVNNPPQRVSDPACGTGRMLLDSARQNPNVELFGQDIDARCAKITAINLGLRQLYGWVVCGNTLTCENRFAYRIAPFYNETPGGTRRGVIRSVPVEQTPALTTSNSLRPSTSDLFAGNDQSTTRPHDTEASAPPPLIMEIPRWLARLEQHLQQADFRQTDDPGLPPDQIPATPADSNQPVPQRPTQGRLF